MGKNPILGTFLTLIILVIVFEGNGLILGEEQRFVSAEYDFTILSNSTSFYNSYFANNTLIASGSFEDVMATTQTTFPSENIVYGLINTDVEVSSYIPLRSNINLTLIDEIKLSDGSSGNILVADTKTNITLRNGVLNGNKDNTVSNYLIYMFNTSNVVIQNMEIKNSDARAIQLFGRLTTNIDVVDCNINNCGGGVVADGLIPDFPSNIYINNNTFNNNYYTSIAFFADDTDFESNSLITNNRIYGSHLNGISENGITIISKCTVQNNIISNVEDNGIELRSADDCIVEDNIISGSGYNGLIIYNSDGNLIRNITISNSGQWATGQNEGLRIFGTSTGNQIENCYIFDNQLFKTQKNGIIEFDTVNGNQITNCTAINNVIVNIYTLTASVSNSYNGTVYIP